MTVFVMFQNAGTIRTGAMNRFTQVTATLVTMCVVIPVDNTTWVPKVNQRQMAHT